MSQWYYAHDGKQSGPVPISELQRLAANGEFDPEKDLVWQEGLPDWKPAAMVPELKSLDPNHQEPASPEPSPAAESSAPTPPAASPSPGPYQPPQSEAAAPTTNKSYAPSSQPSSGMAIGALICGLIGFLTCFFACLSLPCAIAAIILGHLAISRIKRDPANNAGKGLATAGLITGYIGLLLSILYLCFIFWFSTRTPAQIEQIDWLPQEFKEEFQEAFDKQRAKMEELN